MALKSGQLDLQGFPVLRFRPEVSETPPSSPRPGQWWYKESTGVTSIFTQGVWKNISFRTASDSSAIEVFEYQMSTPATTVTIDHGLGRDPVAVQVFHEGVLCDEYGVTFTVPDEQIQIGFDISIAALIRLL